MLDQTSIRFHAYSIGPTLKFLSSHLFKFNRKDPDQSRIWRHTILYNYPTLTEDSTLVSQDPKTTCSATITTSKTEKNLLRIQVSMKFHSLWQDRQLILCKLSPLKNHQFLENTKACIMDFLEWLKKGQISISF